MIAAMLVVDLQRALAELGPRDRVLVACSGGCDSVALAHLTVDVIGQARVVLGHVDHAVRDDSRRAADAVRQIAAELGVECRSTRLPSGSDDEARLRTLRYEALEAQRAEVEAEAILTAHTEDDQAETVLFRLIRNTRGLSGMARRRGRILRPWLGVTRREVRDWAIAKGITWTEDGSNREPRYARNRIRKELLPLIESRYRPGFARRLAAAATPTEPFEAVQRLAAPSEGLASAGEEPAPHAPSIGLERRPWTPGEALPADLRTAVFDADALESPSIRAPRPGDRIQPLGMTGRRKLQDVFVDAKIPRAVRASYPVIVDADVVLWVPGLVRSGVALVSGSTRAVWVFREHLR